MDLLKGHLRDGLELWPQVQVGLGYIGAWKHLVMQSMLSNLYG